MSSVDRVGGALLLGADYRALGVARSLGRRDIPVWVIAEPGEPLATMSRYTRRSLRWPGEAERARIEFLHELATSHGLAGWTLIPSTDRAVAMLARGHLELSLLYRHTSPSWDVLRWVHDKRMTYELAQRVRVPCPWTMSAAGAVRGTASAVRFPAALKPAFKEEHNPLTAAKAWRVRDTAELRSRYAEACGMLDADLLLLQELIEGGGECQLSYVALCREGQPLAWMTARRKRQYPYEFGRASTFVESCECPEIIDPSLRLLEAIRYTGLIEVEYKRDPRDGVVKLLDMNPRVWGWHSLCARAGVDFPWLLWLMAQGEEVPSAHGRAGVSWQRLSTDVPTCLSELAAGRISLRECARALRRPKQAAIFAWDDPLPGLAELPVLAYVLGRRVALREAI